MPRGGPEGRYSVRKKKRPATSPRYLIDPESGLLISGDELNTDWEEQPPKVAPNPQSPTRRDGEDAGGSVDVLDIPESQPRGYLDPEGRLDGPSRQPVPTAKPGSQPARAALPTHNVECPYCSATLDRWDLSAHIVRKHSVTVRALICPLCREDFSPPDQRGWNAFRKHLRRVHQRSVPEKMDSKYVTGIHVPKPLPGQVADGQPRTKGPPPTSAATSANLGEAVSQSDHEPRDGSKHIGTFRRESSGKFGSFPLHDDYGDESDAD